MSNEEIFTKVERINRLASEDHIYPTEFYQCKFGFRTDLAKFADADLAGEIFEALSNRDEGMLEFYAKETFEDLNRGRVAQKEQRSSIEGAWTVEQFESELIISDFVAFKADDDHIVFSFVVAHGDDVARYNYVFSSSGLIRMYKFFEL